VEGTEVLLSPAQYLENVLQIYTVKRIRMREKEDETHVTVIDIQALSYSHMALSRLT